MQFEALLDPTFWLPLAVSIIAVILFYIDMRRRFKQEQDSSKALAELVSSMREELKLFRKQLEGSALSRTELERQKLLAQREQQQWKKIRDIGKTIGWILEHSEDDY